MGEKYTAVIRTLGKAGKKYQQELDSLLKQTITPEEILVYIADGYPIPKETCGLERYVRVKKGMIAQRALPYDEVTTEWILFLDDDVYLPPNAVETLFDQINQLNGDVISPDVFNNSKRSLFAEFIMTISGRMRARRLDNRWGYKVMRTAGYSYNKTPVNGVMHSQSNAGPCFLCRKKDFLAIHFEEEKWLDNMMYPLGEDEIMYYKMYLQGLKVLTSFSSGILHLDACTSIQNSEKDKKMIEADYFFRRVFFDRFILKPECNVVKRLWSHLCIGYFYIFGFAVSALKMEWEILKIKRDAIRHANIFLKSDDYKLLPQIKKEI